MLSHCVGRCEWTADNRSHRPAQHCSAQHILSQRVRPAVFISTDNAPYRMRLTATEPLDSDACQHTALNQPHLRADGLPAYRYYHEMVASCRLRVFGGQKPNCRLSQSAWFVCACCHSLEWWHPFEGYRATGNDSVYTALTQNKTDTIDTQNKTNTDNSSTRRSASIYVQSEHVAIGPPTLHIHSTHTQSETHHYPLSHSHYSHHSLTH